MNVHNSLILLRNSYLLFLAICYCSLRSIGRSDHCHSSDDRGCRGEEQKKPSDYLKQIYFDSLVYRTQNLKHLIDEAGASQLVLGTDYPYGMENRNSVAHVLSVPGLTDEERNAILGGTLSRLLKLDHN